jgi:hypothetical protein
VSSKRDISSVRALSRSREARMSSITASRLPIAMSRPSRMWARRSFSASSNFVRRTMTSRWWLT